MVSCDTFFECEKDCFILKLCVGDMGIKPSSAARQFQLQQLHPEKEYGMADSQVDRAQQLCGCTLQVLHDGGRTLSGNVQAAPTLDFLLKTCSRECSSDVFACPLTLMCL